MTCPACGAAARETMPTNACVHFYTCPSCGTRLEPRPGDCCVFCSYADRRCPPRQAEAPE
ncbi:MAG TPA: GDCCVxC domain-containing (seleno)protein [Gaiellaceae bacterium]|nr:GDCCVxC domain-containing (seleno)protein [Gaiellaceae bacterium]